MIREATLGLCLGLSGFVASARAQAEPAPEEVYAAPAEAPTAAQEPAAEEAKAEEATPIPSDVNPVEASRTPTNLLIERLIGATSRPVRFDWRKTTLGVGAFTSQLSELNNFRSFRAGGVVRMPIGGVLGELGISRVFTWDTDSSEKLAFTPYRQWGRPSRFELDVNASFPLAEGVVTAWPAFFPATELVFSATAGVRYLLYPGAFSDPGFTDVARAIASPRMSGKELNHLDDDRLAAMRVDEARFSLLGGLSLDVYFHNGVFFTPRALIALPWVSAITGTQLGRWWELTLGMGWAF